MAFYDFSKKELQQTDIHSLRNIARSVGVSSPTSKHKENLVEEILAIISGQQEPQYKNANRGRPTKQTANIVYPKETYHFQTFAASPEEKQKNEKSGIVVFDGNKVFVKKLRFVASSSDFDFDAALAKKLKLKDNDVVSYDFDSNGKVRITSINGAPVFDEKKNVLNHTIAFSHSNLILLDTKKEQFVSELSKDIFVLFLPASSLEKVSGENILSLPYCVADDKEIVNNFLATISMATYYQKSGKKVSLVISNILLVEAALKNLALDELAVEVREYISRFLSCGGTLVAMAAKSAKPDKFVIKFENIN